MPSRSLLNSIPCGLRLKAPRIHAAARRDSLTLRYAASVGSDGAATENGSTSAIRRVLKAELRQTVSR